MKYVIETPGKWNKWGYSKTRQLALISVLQFGSCHLITICHLLEALNKPHYCPRQAVRMDGVPSSITRPLVNQHDTDTGRPGGCQWHHPLPCPLFFLHLLIFVSVDGSRAYLSGVSEWFVFLHRNIIGQRCATAHWESALALACLCFFLSKIKQAQEPLKGASFDTE